MNETTNNKHRQEEQTVPTPPQGKERLKSLGLSFYRCLRQQIRESCCLPFR